MANKTRIEFEGFEEVMARLKKLDGDMKGTTEKALKETHAIVTKKALEAIRPHKDTGATERSIKANADVNWSGSLASSEVGFSISKGGLAHIFLMYGTPRMKKDQKLYNAFWSNSTIKEVQAKQEEIFYAEIRRLDS